MHLTGQETPVIQFVNPLIGTSNTQTTSFWGSEGGTYPGAVAPHGFVQLTPETAVKNSRGYDYRDSAIYWFSCVNHMSGYPEGSSGRIKVMPIDEIPDFLPGSYCRSFAHPDEVAEAGYYSVFFKDNGTLVEVTASRRTGMFRFSFPPKTKPRIFIGEAGKSETCSKRLIKCSAYHAIFSFNADFIGEEDIAAGTVLTFPAVDRGKNVIIMKIGTSGVDFTSTERNLQSESDGWDFDHFKHENQQKWLDALTVIELEDPSTVNKTIFYTALYHSLLVPWIISDVQGKYRGGDGLIHETKGKNQYGAFSAWDTFRSLHPLLTLIAPDVQKDIIRSMLDQYEQTGKLPKGPMTGNHVISIIADAYLKGICRSDSLPAFEAMKAALKTASETNEFSAYSKLGYVPSTFSESVTATVEYAYDDWVLAQFAGKIMGDSLSYNQLIKRSFNYRNLFNPESLNLLPRLRNNFNRNPGNSGYKEGDQYSYSLFIPHNPADMINLMGGDSVFAAHLDSLWDNDYLLFDNEPVLHVPYIFNYAHRPDLSQKWIRNLMKSHYNESPWGLPGNDDLGAMSSWYVFSAMGFYPMCPGRTVYDFGSPLFKKVTLHLQNGKKLIISSTNSQEDYPYVKELSLNGLKYNKTWISHTLLVEGGELNFTMDKMPALINNVVSEVVAPSETSRISDCRIIDFSLPVKKVEPDESFFVKFTVHNSGSLGTISVRLFADGKEYCKKNILVNENSTVHDSMECRLYPVGKRILRIAGLEEKEILVTPAANKKRSNIEVISLISKSISKTNEPINFCYFAKNKGGSSDSASFPVLTDDRVIQKTMISLSPGEIKKFTSRVLFKQEGLHKLSVGPLTKRIKIYSDNTDSKVIDLVTSGKITNDTVGDQSGLSNHGFIRGKFLVNNPNNLPFKSSSDNYIEFNGNETLDNPGEKITVMAWIKPTDENRGLRDILTKGDFIALQANGTKSLSWFAGGWGRGTCETTLPVNWVNNWHHIAGVSDRYVLKIFVDGAESASLKINIPVDLSSPARWTIGRNEEFPGQRIFHGFIDHFKIFVEPLTGPEIIKEMQKDRPK